MNGRQIVDVDERVRVGTPEHATPALEDGDGNRFRFRVAPLTVVHELQKPHRHDGIRVLRPQHPLLNRQGRRAESLGIGPSFLQRIRTSQIEAGSECVRVLVAQGPAPPLDDVGVEPLGFLHIPLVPIEVGELMRGSKRLGVVVAQ